MDGFGFRVVVYRKNGTVIVKDGPNYRLFLFNRCRHIDRHIDWHTDRQIDWRLFLWLGTLLNIDSRALVRLKVLSSKTDIDSTALFFDHMALANRFGLLEDLFWR